MRRILGIVWLVALVCGAVSAQKTAKPVPVFTIHGPTIVAFYPHYTKEEQEEIEKGEGDAAVMEDFSFYAAEANKHLKDAGIDFLTKEARSFKVRVGTRVYFFPGGKVNIGYYLIAPGKKPQVEYGVKTDTDLLEVARKYFGKPIP
jgi:hypothetical protein